MRTYRRGEVWYVDYSFKKDRVRYAVGTKNKTDEELERIRYEIRQGIHQPRNKMIFDNLLKEYLAWAIINKKESSYKRDLTSAKCLKEYYHGKFIELITHADAEKYQKQRVDGILKLKGISRKDKVSNATVNREIVLLKHMFKKAVEWDYLKVNRLRNVKLLKEPPGRLRIINAEEWQRLLSACTPEIRNIVIFARHTGLRRGEIFNLTWKDIDFTQRSMAVRNRKNNTTMIVPMKSIVYKLLTNIQRTVNSRYVFPGRHGDKRTTVRTGFETACKKAGISDLVFHHLRHQFGTDLINSGADLLSVKELMGHKCITSTTRYAHPTKEHLRKVLENGTIIVGDDTNLTQSEDDE